MKFTMLNATASRILCVIIGLASVLMLGSCQRPLVSALPQVQIRNAVFSVEIADTDAERQQGLMHRTSLSKNYGMLFVFDTEDTYGFYMKNTLISLDIIWINTNKTIVFMAENTTPLDETVILPTQPARWVLEVKAGTIQEQGIAVGDTVILPGNF